MRTWVKVPSLCLVLGTCIDAVRDALVEVRHCGSVCTDSQRLFLHRRQVALDGLWSWSIKQSLPLALPTVLRVNALMNFCTTVLFVWQWRREGCDSSLQVIAAGRATEKEFDDRSVPHPGSKGGPGGGRLHLPRISSLKRFATSNETIFDTRHRRQRR